MPPKIDLFSLSLVTKFKSALFPQTLWSGAHTILPWVYFPSAWFLKYLLDLLPSDSQYQHFYRIRFPWPGEPNEICATFPSAFWSQTNFDLRLLSLGLVSLKLVGFVSLSFKAPMCI